MIEKVYPAALNVRVTEDQLASLKAEAHAAEQSVSDLVREIIAGRLGEKE